MITNRSNPMEKVNSSDTPEEERPIDPAFSTKRPPALPKRMTQTARPHPPVQREPRVLIISRDLALSNTLISVLDKSGLRAEGVTTIAAGCAFVESGRFQVVLTEPILADGSWRQLTDQFTGRKKSGLSVVVITKTFDLHDWSEALQDGAFDVIDALSDLPKVGTVVRRALLVQYLMGSGPRPESFFQ